MSGLMALRLVRGGEKQNVEILRALAYDNQTSNFTAGDTVTGAGVKGTGTLTGTTIADGDTVTIGDVTYSFEDTLTDEPYFVHVGASDSASLDNLINAINAVGGGTEGTDYGTGNDPNPYVTAAAGAGDTMDVTAITADGVATATTASLTAGDWGAATLAGSILASGATGTLTEQTDGGASGTLILRDVVGEFTDNEELTNGDSADGLANGVLTCPLLTPSDSIIMQVDAEDMLRGEALALLWHIHNKITTMGWHNGSGLVALRANTGEQQADVEELGAVAFDGQNTSLTVGHLITGGASGATGYLVEQTDAGATGTIVLKDIVGLFENNDALTDEGSGDGDATGGQT